MGMIHNFKEMLIVEGIRVDPELSRQSWIQLYAGMAHLYGGRPHSHPVP